MSLGDFSAGSTIYAKFTTVRPSTGAPYTLAGSPAISVYKDNSVTQSIAGVTLSTDFDSVVGLNHITIDTGADGSFYSSGSFFDIVITTGTVDSISAVGAVVGRFTIGKNSSLNLTQANVRSAVGLALANLDTQLAAIPTASGNASAVRTNLTTELGRIDATISSRATPTTGINPNPVTVTVQFSNAPVAGIAVSVLSGNSVIAWGRTNNSGQVVFGLAAGSYSVVAAASVYYEPPAAQSLNVPADTSKTITLVAQSIAAPVMPGLCTVRFAVVHNGSPVNGATVTAEVDTLNSTVDSALVAKTKTTGTTGVNGYVDLTLIRLDAFTFGGVYRINVTDANGTKLYSRFVTVPNVSSCFAEDLVAVS